MLEPLAHQLGVPPDLLKIVACLALNYPLCALLTLVPVRARPLYICALAGVYLLVIFDYSAQLPVLLAQCMFAYALCLFNIGGKLAPWLNQVAQIATLMVTHYKEQTTGEDYVDTIGISGSQMILVIKLTSFVWDFYDGHRTGPLNAHQTASKITELPRLDLYLAFCFFFPAVLTGPTCQFTDFARMINDKPRKTPSPYKPALFRTVEAVIYLVLFLNSDKLSSRDYLLDGRWAATPFVQRACYLGVLASCYQLKYYVAWSFAEAACILCGLGYNGVNEKGRNRWDLLQNVRPIKILTAQNSHGYINNWNINTAKWLRHYVYERVTPEGKKAGVLSTLITFFFSAVWHGTRPGYYLTFVLCAVYQTFGRLLRKRVRPVFMGTSFKFGYDLVCWLVTQAAFGFAVQPFMLLDLRPSLYVWGQVYYWPLIGCAIALLALVWPFGGLYRRLSQDLHKDLATVS